ncbi:electron transfer flavoprotein subunit beta [Corynebacterium phocae]|uniref:Electron transfer flavoprotein subunit beta n=1 Tax=Corynebacterium phocae TaxID=161895 RepID=A0A1L7D3P9_9CORY|nr:electron transfer flavoprotein subunit beta/FixA family protein [Corynebacterium phocae]APT92748.1 electron transfer flavoprotein subunit beta [Corynebacterium phocae]KAA8723059.1 electron transfer flavoprotein subunit beta/FixA family protein [Corynebacterium phocae]
MPTIVALIKHVPDTWSTKALQDDHTLDRVSVDNVIDEVNEYSVEQALRLRDDNPAEEFKVIALTMGPAPAEEALRKALAMGADDAVHVLDDQAAGADALSTAWTLNAALSQVEEKFGEVKLITMGNLSSDGQTGLLAGLLAEYRQIPALTNLVSVAVDGQSVSGEREDAHGTWKLEASLPAIITVNDKADKPRFPNFKGLMAAKKHELTVWDVAALGIAPVGAATQVVEATTLPPRSAGEVISGVSAADAAKQVADFLDNRGLI